MYESKQDGPMPSPPTYEQATSPPVHVVPHPPAVRVARPIITPTAAKLEPIIAPTVHPQVVTSQPLFAPVVVSGALVGKKPCLIMCRVCGCQVLTRVQQEPSVGTHLIAGTMCIVMLWPCVLVPYCLGWANKVHHYCTNCNAYVGTNDNF